MLQSIKYTWHSKDDGTWYRPKHDIDTSVGNMQVMCAAKK